METQLSKAKRKVYDRKQANCEIEIVKSLFSHKKVKQHINAQKFQTNYSASKQRQKATQARRIQVRIESVR